MPKRLLRMFDPVAEVKTENVRPVSPAGKLDGEVVGFIDNGWRSLGPFLTRLKELFGSDLHTSQVVWEKKPDASHAAPQEMMDKLANGCDAVVVGLGN